MCPREDAAHMSLSQEVADLVTDRAMVAYLGTAADDRPLVTPVWYAYRDGSFLVLSYPGEKLDNIRQNPKVGLALQESEDGYPEWKVIARGTAAVVDDVERINRAARRVFATYEGEDESDWDEDFRRQLTDDPTMKLLDISVGSVATSL